MSLQAYENWEPVPYEPIENVLSGLSVPTSPGGSDGVVPKSIKELSERLNIHSEKIIWQWQPTAEINAAALLAHAVMEPDDGMDQNLNISSDQKYMGGFEGLSSQGIRHMYYRAWSIWSPLVTFHFPFHVMGYAPQRAEMYFELARQAKAQNHYFWAYRFLGWGLHYVQDIGQPYHCSQFASLRLLPLRILLSVGWEPFIAETKRIVSNFHLVFERYTDFLLEPSRESQATVAFKVPTGDDNLKYLLEHNSALGIAAGVVRLAETGSELAPQIADVEDELLGNFLWSRKTNIENGFLDETGKPKIDFQKIESDSKLKKPLEKFHDLVVQSLSNTGVATRWYVDRFKAL